MGSEFYMQFLPFGEFYFTLYKWLNSLCVHSRNVFEFSLLVNPLWPTLDTGIAGV